MQLTRGIDILDLPQKQLEILAVLLAADGKVMSRESIIDAVWCDVNVGEHNLTQTIFLLRRSLGKLPDGQEYIETVHRKGYRISAYALLEGKSDISSNPGQAQRENRPLHQISRREDSLFLRAAWYRLRRWILKIRSSSSQRAPGDPAAPDTYKL